MVNQDEPGKLPTWVTGLLRCPVTGASLRQRKGPGEEIDLVSDDTGEPLAYPVQDGVPLLLPDEARRID